MRSAYSFKIAARRVFFVFVLAALLLASCAQNSTPAAPVPTRTARSGQLTPYWTATATHTPTPTDPGTSTPLPSATPTPVIHIVKKDEDMGGIALQYQVSLDQLKTANPDVDPLLLRIGQELVIPGNAPQPTAALPTPTPVPVLLGKVVCYPDLDGGAWCFVLAQNQSASSIESISVLIRAADEQGNALTPQTAAAPLNLLRAGQSMPLAVYFTSPFPASYLASAELLTALPVSADDARYLAAHVENQQVEMTGQGRDASSISAEVTGDVVLEAESGAASTIWVLAVAYDAAGTVCGFRRWESGEGLGAGESLPFSMRVYSSGPPVSRVDVMVEARP